MQLYSPEYVTQNDRNNSKTYNAETQRAEISGIIGRCQGREIACPLNFCLSENFLPNIQNLGLEIPILWKFRGKLKFLAPMISSVGNLHIAVGKLQLPDRVASTCRTCRNTQTPHSWASTPSAPRTGPKCLVHRSALRDAPYYEISIPRYILRMQAD